MVRKRFHRTLFLYFFAIRLNILPVHFFLHFYISSQCRGDYFFIFFFYLFLYWSFPQCFKSISPISHFLSFIYQASVFRLPPVPFSFISPISPSPSVRLPSFQWFPFLSPSALPSISIGRRFSHFFPRISINPSFPFSFLFFQRFPSSLHPLRLINKLMAVQDYWFPFFCRFLISSFL